MSQLGLQHSADIAPCPYLSPGVVLQSVLRSAHHHRQSQLGVGSIPASLLSITALAEKAMAPDCTEQANTPQEPQRSKQKNFGAGRGIAYRTSEAPGLSDWLLRHDVACDWLDGQARRLRETGLEARASKARPSGPTAKHSGGTEFTPARGLAGAPQGRVAGSCTAEDHGPGESAWNIATGPRASEGSAATEPLHGCGTERVGRWH